MQFNSIEFFLFLSIVYLVYWCLLRSSVRRQNVFVIVASYVFYGWWNWRLLGLIVFTSFLGWGGGLLTERVEKKKAKWLVGLNVAINLGILAVFKYYNFFAENLVALGESFGVNINISTLNLLLPVGISFYTFQTLSYVIDVYRGQIKATRDVVAFFAYVSFFPQLVAGPIERATNLLPQFLQKRTFDYEKSVDGLRQILWGMCKKVVIADNCAMIANEVFKHSDDASWLTLLFGALAFTFQIYGDFSGYSDIAIGSSRLFGFDLMTNFRTPYFSSSIPEFWRRWHISLNTWFRDYLYIPLGGNRKGKGRQILNTLIVFGLSGLWHGANWTYIVWGLYFALLSIPYIINKELRRFEGRWWSILLTFILVVGGWIIFRAENMSQAGDVFEGIFTLKSGLAWQELGLSSIMVFTTCGFVLALMAVERYTQVYNHPLQVLSLPRVGRWSIYLLLIFLMLFFVGRAETFIYFQF